MTQRWVCKYCGHIKSQTARPVPGMCPRRPKDKNNKSQPHNWVKD